MTWRVAILAFTIMLAGATAPVIRNQVGGRDGYRVMGVVMALVILSASSPSTAAPATRPSARSSRGRARCASSCGSSPAPATSGWLLTTYVVQALATGCMLAGVDYLATDVLDEHGRLDDPVRLLRRARAAADAAVGAGRRAARQEAGLPAVLAGARHRRALRRPSGVVGAGRGVFTATALVGVGYAGCQVFPLAMLPDAAAVDARRTGSNRAGVYTGVWTAGETLGLALGPGRLRGGAGAGRLRQLDVRRRRAARLRPDRHRARLLPAPGRADPAQPGVAAALLPRRRDVEAAWIRHVGA